MSKVYRTFDEINEKIKEGVAVVLTAEEFKELAAAEGPKEAARKVDVVTTGTFSPMCSSGVFLNFGHSDPPIKMAKIWLNGVPAYGGIAAVDAYLGVAELKEGSNSYGGAHVLEELIDGKKIHLKALGAPTDCYPLEEIDTYIDKDCINECTFFNPRNVYQNYNAATNSTDKILYTYMGTLLPDFGNITYSTSGELSPLVNDPYLRTIGVGTRIFFGGTTGYVAWPGTQNNPSRNRDENGVPIGPASTLSLIGNLKEMNTSFIKAAKFHKYGVSMFVGVGIPIPVLDEEMAQYLTVRNKDIKTGVIDFGVKSRTRPTMEIVNYAQLQSGSISFQGKKIPTAPLSSMYKAREIAQILKKTIAQGEFFLTKPVESFPASVSLKSLNEGKC